MIYRCIACNSAHVAQLGPLPVLTSDFLGQALDGQADTGSMYRCLDCTLQFRAPTPSADDLANYYGHLPASELWQHDANREVWSEIKKALVNAPETSVLDVGCFRGDLLNYLGPEWQRFGIEPSREARAIAESRGIKIIGDSVESFAETGEQFGAITLVDVIEHLLRPLDALLKLVALLKPGGQLIIFTGNTEAWSWRFAGLHYWYSLMPEHVAFFNPYWFERAGPNLKCRVSLTRRLRYQPAPLKTRIDETLKNISYVMYRRIEKFSVFERVLPTLPIINRIGRWEGCWWTSARDHMLLVLTKNNASMKGSDGSQT